MSCKGRHQHGNRVPVLVALGLALALAGTACAPAAPAPAPPPAAPPAAAAVPSTPRPAEPATRPAPAPAPGVPAAPQAGERPAAPAPRGPQPQYGGLLRVVADEPPLNLDFMWEYSSRNTAFLSPIFTGLVKYDSQQNDRIVPSLAERWDLSEDGGALTFRLRQGVLWHDGRPFTAEDARYTVNQWLRTPAGKPVLKKAALEAVGSAAAPDPSTVVLKLQRPSASLLGELAFAYMVMLPRHVIETKGDTLGPGSQIGAGPYKFKGYTEGVKLDLVKNPDYFVKGLPYLDGLVIYAIRDGPTRVAAMKTRQVEFSSPGMIWTASESKQVLETLGDRVAGVRWNRYLGGWVGVRLDKKPFNDVRVRRAISLAMDRQRAVQVLAEGEGILGTSVPPGRWALSQQELARLPGYRQPKDEDLAAARKLLAEAGYPAGFETTILTRSGFKPYEDLAVFTQAELKRIGITLKIVAKEGTTYFAERRRGNFDMVAFSGSPSGPDVTSNKTFWLAPNDLSWDDAKVTELYQKTETAKTDEERLRYVRQIEQRALEEAPFVVTHWLTPYLFWWKNVQNFAPPFGPYNGHRYEDIWLQR